MPNRSTHIATGAGVGAVVALFLPGLSHLHPLERMIWGGGISAIGAAVPDILEPADSPSHRGFAHSYAVLGGSLRGSIGEINPILALLLAGYASHLVLDASTPASLPLIARGT
jgi:inner membrane protein